jgi:hypothetical protein
LDDTRRLGRKKEEVEDSLFSKGFDNLDNFNNSNIIQINNTDNNKKDQPEKPKSNVIIALLILLGLVLQPIYLLIKTVQLMMECYRRLGCLLYIAGSS